MSATVRSRSSRSTTPGSFTTAFLAAASRPGSPSGGLVREVREETVGEVAIGDLFFAHAYTPELTADIDADASALLRRPGSRRWHEGLHPRLPRLQRRQQPRYNRSELVEEVAHEARRRRRGGTGSTRGPPASHPWHVAWGAGSDPCPLVIRADSGQFPWKPLRIA